ncbi:MAG: glycogen/starch synthase [Porphyromonadaceae bacterium]|nr:glycogen/starch synthase [Porphyromonadaceae bacterium]
MMEAKKVLFISQEMTPYLPDSEIATLCRNLPQGIQEKGHEIRAFMPKYGTINERRNQLHEVIRLSGMNLIIDDTDHPLIIKVASIQSARMQVYFIDNDDYFQRKSILLDEEGKDFDDNDERSIFFVRGVMETVKKLRWSPDIIHCHGWFTALAPLFIKKAYGEDPLFRDTKVIYSIYNNRFDVPFPTTFPAKLLWEGIEEKDLCFALNESVDFIHLSQLAIQYSDGFIQASPSVDEKVISEAKASGKPFLPYQTPDLCIDAYNSFYDEVWSATQK